MPNLTGVDLQRAIAERKGWYSFTDGPDGSLWGTPRPTRAFMEVPPWHDDITAAHTLLGELVGKGDGDPIVIVINCDGSMTITFGDKSVDADDFCTAVGNLWLECVG